MCLDKSKGAKFWLKSKGKKEDIITPTKHNWPRERMNGTEEVGVELYKPKELIFMFIDVLWILLLPCDVIQFALNRTEPQSQPKNHQKWHKKSHKNHQSPKKCDFFMKK